MADSDHNNHAVHVLLFPFPSAGHIIPLLDLANHLIINHHLKLTVLVTPPNLPLLDPILAIHPSDSIQKLVLQIPESLNTSNSLASKILATSELYNPIVKWFQTHPSPPVAIISDFFLGWTHSLACQLGIPRIVFWPSGAFTCLVISHIWNNLEDIFSTPNENSMLRFPNIPNTPEYPRWQVCTMSSQYKKGDPDWELVRSGFLDNMKSWGALFNSCRQVEGVYIDRVKEEMGHDRVWAVGPLLPLDNGADYFQRGGSSVVPRDEVMTWLDDKVDDSVVYVSFGSRTTLTREQTNALATALECSRMNFVWCLRGHVTGDENANVVTKEYENRVGKRGLLVKGWAPQVAILRHRAVGVFLTHCGWNSVLEGLLSNVLMLTWPMGADQFTSAKMLVDELKVGIKVCESGCPDSIELAHILSESINGAGPQKERMRKLHHDVFEAAQKGGTSSQDLHVFIKQLNQLQNETS